MPEPSRFSTREQAGKLLAARLRAYAYRADVTVIGLPRGGVAVAAAVAAILDVALDIVLVRKLGVPGHPEYAMGAVASGGLRVLQPDTVAELHIPAAVIEQVAEHEAAEIARREALYGAHAPGPALQGRVLIVVDDGLATGATMWAAVEALRQAGPARMVVAVPVGAPDTCAALRPRVDELVCLREPSPFFAVGQWYRDFRQIDDAEVSALLAAARQRRHP
ncbi:phosphoribosyltransferase [Massilia sp. DWR3-1-1]|uniref:phosphoribosyltransferase n=1 Tax=Massilia sp. DWR3-1-1 TaxID=2804559 RepID=UPI003CF1D098